MDFFFCVTVLVEEIHYSDHLWEFQIFSDEIQILLKLQNKFNFNFHLTCFGDKINQCSIYKLMCLIS